MAEKNIELDSVEVAAAVLATATGTSVCWRTNFLLRRSAGARSCGFQANRPMLPRPAALWRECCF